MLVNFTVGNFRSFKEKRTLSMEAANIKEFADSLITTQNGVSLLPIAALYGANSSGKSNFLRALGVFTDLLRRSNSMNSTEEINVVPFLLSENVDLNTSPSYFEIEVITPSNNFYRYGFEANRKSIVSEWLYKLSGSKETCLFVRENDSIGVTKAFPEGKGLEERTRNNALFLSVCDSFNGVIAKELVFDICKCIVTSAVNHEDIYNTIDPIVHQNAELYADVVKETNAILHQMDLGFSRYEIPENKELAKNIKAYTYHNLYDANGKVVGEVRLSMKYEESEGTNKLFDIITMILMSLKGGGLLVIDELDCKLHPILTAYIIKMFNDPKQNEAHGQLIFATHDSNLLSAKCLRRDEVWFVEKDKQESSDLYSLVEFKDADGVKVRNDRSFEKDYIKGRYGAIPYVNYNW